ncbi:MAG: methyltransferase domain-containing protein [Stellaceae bacterium]
MTLNAQYNLARAESLAARIARHQRRKMYRAFLDLDAGSGTILDIGVTSDRSYDHSNYLEAWHKRPQAITAIGLDAGAATHPALARSSFAVADGRALPFADDRFDYVHASAVIEHVGSRARQIALVAEAYRVARRAAFLTTPNRWFPIELHTTLPLLHWLPPRRFRAVLAATGFGFFADENNLNLLTGNQLRRLAAGIAPPDKIELRAIRLGGWASNLALVLRKT